MLKKFISLNTYAFLCVGQSLLDVHVFYMPIAIFVLFSLLSLSAHALSTQPSANRAEIKNLIIILISTIQFLIEDFL